MNRPSTFPKTKVPPTIWDLIGAEVVRRAGLGQDVVALHVGDTHLPLQAPLAEPAPDEEHVFGTRLNRYGDTFGEPPLRELLLDKVRTRNRLPATGIDCIQITGGAGGGLHAGFSRLLEPGAELLVPSPYWSLLRVVAEQARVRIVEVPFFDRMASEGDFGVAETLEQYVTDRTAGLYVNTPSNPTGMLLDGEQLEGMAAFARKHDLWVFSDEAYEDFIWEGSEQVSIGSLPGMFERTVSIHTLSKCFGISGVRVGYVTANAPVVAELNRGVVGSYYHAGRLDQLLAWRGMLRFDEVLQPLRDDYESTWRWTRTHLKADALPSVGGFYFFLRLGPTWSGIPPEEKVDKMLDLGVVLAPGEYFGDDYRDWARLCFTVVPPEELKRGVELLNRIIL